jgi:hypothetical protein
MLSLISQLAMGFKKTRFFIFASFLLVIISCFFLVNCDSPEKPVAVNDGKSLSLTYCKSCHQYPDAALLDQQTWKKKVLPAMAPRLGIKVYMDDQYVYNPTAKAAISYDDWLKIVDYYTHEAPKKLQPAKVPVAPLKDWANFSVIKPAHEEALATTTMVAFDTIGNSIYTSDRMNSSVFQWSNQLKLKSSVKFASPAVDVQFQKQNAGEEQGVFTFIGSMDAIDVANGFVNQMPLKSLGDQNKVQIAAQLPRPVQSIPADFNKDGLQDWVVCGFGHNFGGLYWYKQLPGGEFEKHIISSMPGAEHAVIGDFNHDGWPDIACLFAQANEGVWLFLNDHKGGFTTQNLLKFPPVYGSSSFQLVDFNHDGQLDILYTSGDNSDYSRVLKPYHGVYIFMNQGNFKFKQAWFYPVNGATKAVAADFNGDGKLGIALIAFFPDLKTNPGEGFTYFEQDQPMHFIPHNLPIYKLGRWICMDVKDYNGDGRPDIILGNFSMGFINDSSVTPDWNTHLPFIVLKNESKIKEH